jgi:hypothetical protein
VLPLTLTGSPRVDLNELFFRHQLALMQGDRAEGDARVRFGQQAECLASRIGTLQQRLGAPGMQLAQVAA